MIKKVHIQLTEKAKDTAALINERINTFVATLTAIARQEALRKDIPYEQKISILAHELAFNHSEINAFGLCDKEGNVWLTDGRQSNVADREYYQSALNGKVFVTEPMLSRTTNALVTFFSVPIYDDEKQIIGVLYARVDASGLSKMITGCRILYMER